MSVEAFLDSNVLLYVSPVAAAIRLDAPVLYSEDLSDGQFYGRVQVINPFA